MTDDGIVLAVDRNQLITYSSLCRANELLTTELFKADVRFETALDQVLILKRTVEQQDEELERLHGLPATD
jgi:hypothetical protein